MSPRKRTEHWCEIWKKGRENYTQVDVVNLNFNICFMDYICKFDVTFQISYTFCILIYSRDYKWNERELI